MLGLNKIFSMDSGKTKKARSLSHLSPFIFFPERLFFLRQGLQTFGADFLAHPVNLFGLQIDGEFPISFHLGMADLVSDLAAAAANIAYSRHIRFAQVSKSLK